VMRGRAIGITFAVLATATAASAQQRPLTVEDPETVGNGRLLLEAGLDYLIDQQYPGSGLSGNLLRLPALGVSIGLGSIAELQMDGAFYQRLSIEDREAAPLAPALDITGDTTAGVDDTIVATKIKFLSEGVSRPAMAIRLGTKLPTASNETGLGLDTTDFLASLLIAKTVGSTRVVGNGGVAILGDPLRASRQSDLLTYGVSLARAVAQGVEIVGELSGRANFAEDIPTVGAETRAILRGGIRYTYGAGRVDAGMLLGLTTTDPAFGLTFGYTHVFDAFNVP
jgi:Putative MetA-pathway of phenol degradation